MVLLKGEVVWSATLTTWTKRKQSDCCRNFNLRARQLRGLVAHELEHAADLIEGMEFKHSSRAFWGAAHTAVRHNEE
jgi:hypothetical protein